VKTITKEPKARLTSWLDERVGLWDIVAFARKKTVPVHQHTFWYYWGGLSLFFFIVQAFTGVLLLIYYRPGPDAFESVRQINFDTSFGWLIRSAHSWAANLMILAIFVHMFSAFFMKAYYRPREFTWFSGLALLLLTMLFGFSGYLLPMNELAYFATKVGLAIPAALPGIGPKLAELVRGGPDVTEFTVQRFFALHVVVLPAIFMGLLTFHLWLVQKHGNAVPPKVAAIPEAERHSMPFFPDFFAKDMALWLIALNVLALLASMFPWDLGNQADVLKPAPNNIHPEWYFMSSFQVLKLFGHIFGGKMAGFGEGFGIITFTLGLVLWLLIPLYDTDTKLGRRARRATWFGLLALAVLVITTIWGYAALK